MKDCQMQVYIDEESFTFFADSIEQWKISKSQILVVGEFTNQDGPFSPDHFLVFVDTDARIYEIPIDVDGVEPVLNELRESFPASSFTLSLLNQVDFCSHILFPSELVGMPLFDFHSESKTLKEKVLKYFGADVTYRDISVPVRQYIEARSD